MSDLLERARRLGHERFAAIAAEGEPGRLDRPLVKALGDEGLLELVFAGSAQELCQLREGLAHGCTEAETALALQGLGGYPILRAAKPELRDRWIPKLSAGEAVAAFALSEPEAGSDAAALELRAEDGRRRLPADRHEALDLQRARGGRLLRLRPHLRRRREGDHGLCDPARE